MSENNPSVVVTYDPATDVLSVDKSTVKVKKGQQRITWHLATINPTIGNLSWAANGIQFVTKPNKSDWLNGQPQQNGQVYQVSYNNGQTSGTTTYGYSVNTTYTPAGGS